jgi:beta-xylosidase
MRLQGCVGGEYAIEGSTDLRNWTTLLTVTNRMGQVELPQFEEPKTGNSYYRARLVR